MFWKSNDIHHAGTVERIGFASTGEMSNRYVLLLVGQSEPVILRGNVLPGEYERAIQSLAITAPGDEVELTMSGTKLKSFRNRTLDARFRTGL